MEHKNKVFRARHKDKLRCIYYFSPMIFGPILNKKIGEKTLQTGIV